MLAEEVGYPYNQVPTESFLGYGGGFGHASLCGTVATGTNFIYSVCDKETASKLSKELYKWYKEASFPYYQPEGQDLKQTVANSTLCGDSVAIWMEETGFEFGSDERKTRCAGVTADTAKKVIELLNAELG